MSPIMAFGITCMVFAFIGAVGVLGLCIVGKHLAG